MRQIIRTLLCLMAVALFTCRMPADACTAVYIGRNCSASGNVIIARSADSHNFLRHIEIVPAQKGKPGRVIKDMDGFVWSLPDDTYKYVGVPYADIVDIGHYASAVTNECGLAVSATVTGYNCPAAKAADPNVPDGISEKTLPSILAACCRTAREAVELTARIVDEKGSSEQNVVMMADANEAWYMEIYSGHQYCAVKMPEDLVAVLGNEFMLGTVEGGDDSLICSEGLFSIPEEKGFAVKEADGRINLSRTYMGDGRYYDFSHMRTWRGHQLLAPATAGKYNAKKAYPLFFAPEGKVSLAQVMSLFRDRYQGTQYDPDVNGRQDIRVIGEEEQGMVHIIEVYDNVPAEMACVTWLTLSEAAYAPFIPISNAIIDCDRRYSHEVTRFGYDSSSATMLYKRLNSLCAQKRQQYGPNVRKYWEAIESQLIEEMPKVLAEAASGKYGKARLSSYCRSLQVEALSDAQRIFDELTWYMVNNTYTYTYDYSFETLKDTKAADATPFDPLCDVERFAKWAGWKSDGLTFTSADGASVIFETSNGHKNDSGSISFNSRDGFNYRIDGRVESIDGKLYAPVTALVRVGMIK